MVEFEQAKYSVNEIDAHGNDNIFGVCFVVASDCDCPIDFNVYLSVSSGAFGKLVIIIPSVTELEMSL